MVVVVGVIIVGRRSCYCFTIVVVGCWLLVVGVVGVAAVVDCCWWWSIPWRYAISA